MTVHLASEFAQKGWRVLVIDMDEQCNTTNFYHGNRRGFKGNISMMLEEGVSTPYCIEKLSATLHLIPGSPDIKYFDNEDETILKRALEIPYVQNRYDIVFIDNPPAFNNKTLNSFTASTHALIVSETSEFSISGLSQCTTDIQSVRDSSNPNLEVIGIAINKVHGRRKLDKHYLKTIRNAYPNLVFTNCLHDYAEIERAILAGKTVCKAHPSSNAAIQIRAIAKELMEKLKRSTYGHAKIEENTETGYTQSSGPTTNAAG